MLLLVLHVLGATIWTGGHLVLALTVLPRALTKKDVTIIQDFEAGFERIGIPALLVQIVTGVLLALRALGPPNQWLDVGNPLARVVLVKLCMLLATLALALHARLRIIPKLTPQTLGLLAVHISLVTILAVAFVVFGVSFRFGGF